MNHSRRRPRVFLGLTEVSGYYSQLRKGFAELGVECVHAPIQSHRFAYEEDCDMACPVRLARFFVKRRVAVPERARARRLLWLMPVLATRLILFLWAVRRFDVFILGGGSSFFRFLELPVLRLVGRRVVYVLHGTDARPAYLDGAFYQERHAATRIESLDPPELDDELVDAYVAATRSRKRDLRWIQRYAEVIVCGPGFAQLVERPYINFAAIGIPFKPPAIPYNMQEVAPAEEGVVRILHATSDRVGRGTKNIRRIVAELQEEGVRIEFREFSGQPHAKVLAELQACDFVIDGTYADTPMAGFATEAAWFGKPVVMGGYYVDYVARDMFPPSIPPTTFSRMDQMKESIRLLARNGELRAEVGGRMCAFVRDTWSPRSVASRFLDMLAGRGPAEWWCDPYRQTYIYGGGISADRIRANVAAIVARHGVEALALEHNPGLRDELLVFACGNAPL